MNSQTSPVIERQPSFPALPSEESSEGGRHLGESIENRLSIKDFTEIQNLFKSPELNPPECMSKEEFMERTYAAMRHGAKEEYGDLFDKIDVSREGFIDWDKLTSFMLLELYEKDERVKSSVIPQWKDIRSLPLIHKENIQKVVYLKGSCRYVTLSKDGLLGVWGENLKLQRSLRICTDTVKLKDLWATSLVFLANVNKIAVAFTSKEICFYDLSSKQDLFCQYKLQVLPATPVCMDYWHNPDDGNDAILTFGDVNGKVQAIYFTAAIISLFERPVNSTEDQQTTLYIPWKEVVGGFHKCCSTAKHELHDNNWVRQVTYSSHLEAFLSCTTSDNNTVILAWREKGKTHLRTTSLNIAKGINGFDYDSGLNIIATAGNDHKICLWNPYVVSKPTGILQGNMASVITVKFIASRKQLFSFSKDKVLRVWDIHHQVCIQRIAGIFPKTVEFHLSFYFCEPHGRLFLSFNNQLSVLEMKKEASKRVTSHEKPVTCVLYNFTFKQVISSDTGSTITFWMIDTGRKIKQFSGCHGNAEISTMALDASETRLLTGSTDGTVKIWDFNGHCHHKLNAGRDRTVEISQILVLKRTILVVGWAREITVFRLNTFTQYLVQPSEWKGGVQHHDDILCAAFLPPQSLVTGSYDGEMIVWNNNTENASRKLHPDPPKAWSSKSDSQLHSAGKRSISSSSSGRYTYSSSGFCSAESDSNNTVTRLFFLGARKHISATGGANLVSCGGSGYVRFWNIFRNQLMGEFQAHEGQSFIVMTIEKTNKYLITGDLDGWIKVWDIQEYCTDYIENKNVDPPPLVTSFQPHSDCVTHIETCTQNRCLLILSASADCSLCVSDMFGNPVGIFGQEEHWRIEQRSLIAEGDGGLENIQEMTGDLTSSNNESAVQSDNLALELLNEEIEELPFKNSPWENTVLGRKYRRNGLKEKLHSNFIGNSVQHAIGTFSLLNISSLRETAEMSKPDFVVNPDKYFGEKVEENISEIVEFPTFPETLKAVFDEGSLFPREILEREQEAKQLNERMFQESRIKRNKKTTRIIEK
ncbi:cilia- and flagella-associated protein 337 isoform X1 [Eleutherodactylus coqui]|uniref:cilia- and flagella-associated protein 337 isoform X1 n=1 Tax=Eleutherodactylus coqui TaxID=57060 RepID=UPI0034629C59